MIPPPSYRTKGFFIHEDFTPISLASLTRTNDITGPHSTYQKRKRKLQAHTSFFRYYDWKRELRVFWKFNGLYILENHMLSSPNPTCHMGLLGSPLPAC